ncbi:hypothetical protein BH09ACT1_BH09ACT1_24610 [soil metagenome]
MTIDWGALVLVFVVALAVTTAVVAIYSLGLRLLGAGSVEGSRVARARPLGATLAAYLCIGISAATVLYGVYLVIPVFHS